MSQDRKFEYLLNAFEHASQSPTPAKLNYAAKRRALFDYEAGLRADVVRLYQWVRALQDGDQVNCVYCGWSAGPRESTAPALHEQLFQHVRQCPQHPMAALHRHFDELCEAAGQLEVFCREHSITSPPEAAVEQGRLVMRLSEVLNRPTAAEKVEVIE